MHIEIIPTSAHLLYPFIHFLQTEGSLSTAIVFILVDVKYLLV